MTGIFLQLLARLRDIQLPAQTFKQTNAILILNFRYRSADRRLRDVKLLCRLAHTAEICNSKKNTHISQCHDFLLFLLYF